MWSFRFDEGNTYDPYLSDFTVNRRGNVVVCGKQWNLQDAAASDGNGFLPWFAEVSKDGELLWERWVGWPTICDSNVCNILSSFEQIQATDDDGYILTGQYGLGNATVEARLLKVDNMGCLEPGCTDREVMVPVREPGVGKPEAFRIAPNPASNVLTVSGISEVQGEQTISLINVSGISVLEQVVPDGVSSVILHNMKQIMLISLVIIFAVPCYSQFHDNTTLIGFHGGIATPPGQSDIYGISVLTFPNASLHVEENTELIAFFDMTNSSLSDSSGKLQLYTNGVDIGNAAWVHCKMAGR